MGVPLDAVPCQTSGPLADFLVLLQSRFTLGRDKRPMSRRISTFRTTNAASVVSRLSACRVYVGVCLLLVATATLCHAQTYPTRIFGAADQDFPTPQPFPLSGQKDSAALQEIIDFIGATGAGTWKGIQGSGTMSYPGKSGEESDSATLTILNGNRFRLDVAVAGGTRSIRIK